MKTKAGHLTYCSNIHPGEDWNTHFAQLQAHLPGIKSKISPAEKMGIGLRLSHQMSLDLSDPNILKEFQDWMDGNGFYVYIINGFPYGQFHDTVIKDQVHTPDWTTSDRLEYTIRLIELLANILPEDMDEGGISTPPLSYRHWHETTYHKNVALDAATRNIIQTADHLHTLHQTTGKNVHLDLEPEPDGLIENGEEFIYWYEDILIPMAQKQLGYKGLKPTISEEIIRRHIRLCYDVCHMAVEFEDQLKLTNRLRTLDIPIGRIQLSSALSVPPETNPEVLRTFDEPQYLHQVVVKDPSGELVKFKDLGPALESNSHTDFEWRVHFHVPLFTEKYGDLHSTRDYIDEILKIHRRNPLTNFFEIETYTWNVLPEDLQFPIGKSIAREFQYVLDNL